VGRYTVADCKASSSTPALSGSDDDVVAATQAGDLVVLDPANSGTESQRVGIGSETLSSPTVDNGEVFIGSEGGDFVGFN